MAGDSGMAGKVALLLWGECPRHGPDAPGMGPGEAESGGEGAEGGCGDPEVPKASRARAWAWTPG